MAAIFRGYDQAGLDRQYNNRARVADFGALHRRWVEQSATVVAGVRATRGIAYGADPRQSFDVFHAAEATRGAASCLAFIHGGYWQALSKEDCSFIVAPFVAAGISVAMIEYRLCPDVTMTEIAADTRLAFAKLYEQASALGIDRERIVVAGHSAGGQLATLLMSEDMSALGLSDDAIKGVVSISGLYELEPIRLSFLNAALKMDAAEARALSPALRVPRRKCPVILTLGGDEPEEYQRQQSEFAAAWRQHGIEPQIIPGPGNHFDAMEALADTRHPLFAATAGLLMA